MYSPTVLAQTPDGDTPANEGVCDSLIGLTPGLYGLCVAYCEAQDCDASVGPITGAVTFDESCLPSNPKLLANYNKRMYPGDPPMPCSIQPPECACWTEIELDALADKAVAACEVIPSEEKAILSGTNHYNGLDIARASYSINAPSCFIRYTNPGNTGLTTRFMTTTPEEAQICRQSLVDECASRGFPP